MLNLKEVVIARIVVNVVVLRNGIIAIRTLEH